MSNKSKWIKAIGVAATVIGVIDELRLIPTEIGSQVFGIVEFADCVKRVQPDEIIFCDEQSDYLAQLNGVHGGTKKGENK